MFSIVVVVCIALMVASNVPAVVMLVVIIPSPRNILIMHQSICCAHFSLNGKVFAPPIKFSVLLFILRLKDICCSYFVTSQILLFFNIDDQVHLAVRFDRAVWVEICIWRKGIVTTRFIWATCWSLAFPLNLDTVWSVIQVFSWFWSRYVDPGNWPAVASVQVNWKFLEFWMNQTVLKSLVCQILVIWLCTPVKEKMPLKSFNLVFMSSCLHMKFKI